MSHKQDQALTLSLITRDNVWNFEAEWQAEKTMWSNSY